jgi:hypothetical protein
VNAPGDIRWGASPEIDTSKFPAMSGGHPQRCTSFANLGGRLYAAIGQAVYRRTDGAGASWRKMWTNPSPGTSQTGCRGLTAVDGKLWVGVEGTECRVASIDTNSWKDTTEFDVNGKYKYYQIVAYNDFCVTKGPDGSELVLTGLDGSQKSAAKYIVRYHWKWSKRSIPALMSFPMVSVRTIIASPFEDGVIYWGGYDCNSHPSKDTAWIATSSVTDVTSAAAAAYEVEEVDEVEMDEERLGRFKHAEHEDEGLAEEV